MRTSSIFALFGLSIVSVLYSNAQPRPAVPAKRPVVAEKSVPPPAPACALNGGGPVEATEERSFDITLPPGSPAANGTETVTYSWDFGDGSPVVTQGQPTHKFAAKGTFLASVRADVGANRICERDWIQYVEPKKFGPIIVLALSEFFSQLHVTAIDPLEVRGIAVNRNYDKVEWFITRDSEARAPGPGSAFIAAGQPFGGKEPIVGSATYPVKVTIIESSPTDTGKTSLCLINPPELVMRPANDLAIRGADLTSQFTAFPGYPWRVTSGSLKCNIFVAIGDTSIRMLSGSVRDVGGSQFDLRSLRAERRGIGGIEFDQGTRALVNGREFQYDGGTWKGGDDAPPSPAALPTLASRVHHLPSLLAMVIESTNPDVRSAALGAISDQGTLLEAVLASSAEDTGAEALRRITSRQRLAKVASDARLLSLRDEAKRRLAALAPTVTKAPVAKK